ncbi:methyl-accepting chemotaxis protein [Paraburkholderia phosphatilytica]|uniref:methyl-accepting chemotaxis protein n=1 Tax=Paraburkholderia phosphatilytica TaxID=2282883 RepID=UPI000E52A73C|nr:methyl-accepting chemotaxis protein [Paraburkholderia phosphatilytica]
MLDRWSIRATLTAAGAVLVMFTVAVGALGLSALGNAMSSIESIAHGDMIAIRDLNDSSTYLLRSRIALDRVSSLLAAGETEDAKKGLARAQQLLDLSKQNWDGFLATPKKGVDQALIDAVTAKRASLLNDGVSPEVAALNNSDLTTYHSIADVKITTMFVAYDNAATPVIKALQQSADAEESDTVSKISSMRALIIGVVIAAIALVVVIRFALRGLIMQPLSDAIEAFERISSGDLTKPVTHTSRNEMGRLFDGLRKMQASLSTLVKTVHTNAESIDTGAREIAMGNTDLSQRTEEQAASLQETASSMEQLTGTVRQNAENARQASQLAVNASDIAKRGGEVVGQVVDTMRDIASSSGKVVDIISVIEGIAFQTNILALNAAVEAARAGEQGRGFAVVAGEVRSLAQRSASAAKEIKELIGDASTKVEGGTELVSRAGTTMDEIVQAVRRVTDIMGEISAASEEQSGGIEQVSRAVNQMDEVTQQNAALVEQAAAAAASLEEQTRSLQGVISTWRVANGDSIVARVRPGAAAPHSAKPAFKKPAPAAVKQVTAAAKSAPAAASPAVPAKAAAVAPAAAAKPGATVTRREPVLKPKLAARAAATAAAPATAGSDADWETF